MNIRWIAAEQQIDMEGTTMRRRSRRSKPINMLGAFLVEAGTMLAIVALAQPTWTSNLIEQISPASQASANSVQSQPVVDSAVATTASAVQASEPLRAMQPADDTTERLAMGGWSASRLPVNEYSAAAQYSQYSVDPYATGQHYSSSPQLNPSSAMRPIYPPPASSQSMPAWSNSY